jgi:hypothetical protein
MTKMAAAIESSKVPIVPQTVVNMGGGDGNDSGMGNNAFGLLMALLTSEKLGAPIAVQASDATRSAQVTALRQSVMDGATKVPENTGTGASAAAAAPAAKEAPAARPMQSTVVPETHKKDKPAEDEPKAK